ncbi:TetR/AcrR family transcriptional regulator [Bailinhaonella thermotolerans]|uniref:TetR/AcrR family transcriptional regulator n=1 Tax=Bailinhaonella thermotolerans TaxID=1070861 RepID=A0A3A4AX36_9ACTN|nr:TetR/AcrR family transcriptional regulator [Bailinhaonella thermotolerans]RJL31944.1 TetR/AcrR family transcriptional regulator [Bailinhaonella thermotolerans]
MAGKRDWLETGLRVLGRDGARALTVERLCAELDLTKGSFYHHFKGMAGFTADLLAYFEIEHTGRLIDEVEARGPEGGRAKLARLLDLVVADETRHAGLESAVRAWAFQDPKVHAVQERVDRRRVDYLRGLCREMGVPDAEPMAELFHLVLVGAQQSVPPVGPDALRDVYTLALRLAPEEEEKA